MYGQGQRSGGKKQVRFTGGRTGRQGRGDGRERTRLLQLLVCLALFLTVFIGKGVFPTGLVRVRENVLSLISSDTDFRGAFARLGESLSGREALLGELGDFCAAVFGVEEVPLPEEPDPMPVPQLTSLLQSEQKFLSGDRNRQALTDHFLPDGELAWTPPADQAPRSRPEEGAPGPSPAAVAAVGAVLLKSDYDGEAPPERYTMDQLSLGGLETAAPVLGRITSAYGYRDHPISGKHQFHGGMDVSGRPGDPIRAFAAGTVEYVGENDSYGLYFQLDHGNGVKSFYAHCESVCVRKGQTVALGEKVAEVGASGTVTGPHLHLELKCGDLRVDPAYYVETLAVQ